MAEFCTKCFAALNEQGRCPVCDAGAAPVAAPVYDGDLTQRVRQVPGQPAYGVPVTPVAPAMRFCPRCGNALDAQGRCPVCDAPAPVPRFCMRCGGPLDENGQCAACDAPPAASLASMAQTAVEEESPVEETTPEKKEPKPVSVGTVVATVLLSICLFITMLLSVSVLTVRSTVRKGGVVKVIEQTDLPQLLKSIGGADGAAFQTLYDRFGEHYSIPLDDERLGKLIEHSTVPKYISEKTDGFTSDFFGGEAELVVTKAEMIKLVKENKVLLEREIAADAEQQELTDEDCERIAGWLFNDKERTIISTEQLQKDAPALYQTINIGFSWFALAFFLLLSVLIGFVMCRNSLSQAAIGGGVVFILLGGFTTLAAALVAWIPGLWATIAGESIGLNVSGAVFAANGWIFGSLLFLGIAMLAARTVVKYLISD